MNIVGFENITVAGMFLVGEDGEYYKIESDIPYVEIVTEDSDDVTMDRFLPQDFEGSIHINNSRRNWNNIKRLVRGTNNWRKLHGLPMLHYKRYRHEKRG